MILLALLQAPSTLLAQIDSSIGGKNGINSSYGKNLIGTFYQPKGVLIDISVLNSLPKKEILSGYAEIIKHALIKDYTFFCWLEQKANKLLSLNKSTLEKAIYKSIMIKLNYVIKDQKEFLLNDNISLMPIEGVKYLNGSIKPSSSWLFSNVSFSNNFS